MSLASTASVAQGARQLTYTGLLGLQQMERWAGGCAEPAAWKREAALPGQQPHCPAALPAAAVEWVESRHIRRRPTADHRRLSGRWAAGAQAPPALPQQRSGPPDGLELLLPSHPPRSIWVGAGRRPSLWWRWGARAAPARTSSAPAARRAAGAARPAGPRAFASSPCRRPAMPESPSVRSKAGSTRFTRIRKLRSLTPRARSAAGAKVPSPLLQTPHCS